MLLGPTGTWPNWRRKEEVSLGDAVGEDGDLALAESGGALPGEFRGGVGVEDGEEAAAEFAGGEGSAGIEVIEESGPAVDEHQLVLFVMFEVGELDGEGVQHAAAVVPAGIFGAMDDLGADEIGEGGGVGEGGVAGLGEQFGLFRSERRRGRALGRGGGFRQAQHEDDRHCRNQIHALTGAAARISGLTPVNLAKFLWKRAARWSAALS